MNAAELMQILSYVFTTMGGLAFIVSMIVQVIKEMPKLKEVPTNAVTLAVALILCPVTVVIACQYFNVVLTWYYLFASLIAAFMVYLIAPVDGNGSRRCGSGQNTGANSGLPLLTSICRSTRNSGIIRYGGVAK